MRSVREIVEGLDAKAAAAYEEPDIETLEDTLRMDLEADNKEAGGKYASRIFQDWDDGQEDNAEETKVEEAGLRPAPAPETPARVGDHLRLQMFSEER
jgi:hypothetical protein